MCVGAQRIVVRVPDLDQPTWVTRRRWRTLDHADGVNARSNPYVFHGSLVEEVMV